MADADYHTSTICSLSRRPSKSRTIPMLFKGGLPTCEASWLADYTQSMFNLKFLWISLATRQTRKYKRFTENPQSSKNFLLFIFLSRTLRLNTSCAKSLHIRDSTFRTSASAIEGEPWTGST